MERRGGADHGRSFYSRRLLAHSAHLRIDALTLKLHTTVAPIVINFDNETAQMPEYSDGVAITVSALGKGPAVERPNLG